MPIKIYEYKNCTTCKKALNFLEAHNISYIKFPIVENPPSVLELKKMLQFIKNDGGSFQKLFNTSGILYREMNIAKKIKNGMTEKEALKLLSLHGKLIKRPFLLTPQGGTVGFKLEIWTQLLLANR